MREELERNGNEISQNGESEKKKRVRGRQRVKKQIFINNNSFLIATDKSLPLPATRYRIDLNEFLGHSAA